MHYLTALTCLFLAQAGLSNLGSNTAIQPLIISVRCRDNPSCIFEQNDVIVEMTITNATDHEIGLPLEYLRKKGLHCYLTDNESGKMITLNMSLTPASIKRRFVKLNAGESTTISRTIDAGLILSIRKTNINLIVHVGISGVIQMRNDDEPIEFVDGADIVITGKDS